MTCLRAMHCHPAADRAPDAYILPTFACMTSASWLQTTAKDKLAVVVALIDVMQSCKGALSEAHTSPGAASNLLRLILRQGYFTPLLVMRMPRCPCQCQRWAQEAYCAILHKRLPEPCMTLAWLRC